MQQAPIDESQGFTRQVLQRYVLRGVHQTTDAREFEQLGKQPAHDLGRSADVLDVLLHPFDVASQRILF